MPSRTVVVRVEARLWRWRTGLAWSYVSLRALFTSAYYVGGKLLNRRIR